jgi:hypothetical protein
MRIATLVVVALLATVVVVNAQNPYIAVYFDQYYGQETKDCPGFVIDTWYVAAVNFNTFVTGADFKINYPAAVTYLADLNVPPVKVGNTNIGLSMAFALPQNGYNLVPLCQVQVFWNCDDCDRPAGLYVNNQVKVVANPFTNFLGVTDFPNFNLVPGQGLTAVICPTSVPVEETTWGQVKALYGE